MSDIVTVRSRMDTLDVSPKFEAYSKVIIKVNDDEAYVSGDDVGRVLEIDNPFGTQEMADAMLESLKGYQYQPYDADGAHLDPSSEIGDALNTAKVYGGIYSRSRTFSRLMKADVSAPQDEEIDHEYEYVSATQREFTRRFGDVKATLAVHNDMIEARVSKKSPEGQTSFGWNLTDTEWTVNTETTTILRASKNGLEVTGKITATSGEIGGFTIGRTAIYNNLSSFGGTATNGVYLGTNGIQLGQNFKVTTSGAVTASSLTLKGTLTFLNNDGTVAGTMSAADLRNKVNHSYASTTDGGYCYGGAGGGYHFEDMSRMAYTPSWVMCGNLAVGGSAAQWRSSSVMNSAGIPITISYLGYQT